MNTRVMEERGYFDPFKYSWIHIFNCLEDLFGQSLQENYLGRVREMRREIKVGYCNLLCRHENYSRDYFRRLMIVAIFRWLLAGIGSCFQTAGRLTHARDQKLQVALAAGCQPSASGLAAFHRALEGELPAWAKGSWKDFSPFSNDTPCIPGTQLLLDKEKLLTTQEEFGRGKYVFLGNKASVLTVLMENEILVSLLQL